MDQQSSRTLIVFFANSPECPGRYIYELLYPEFKNNFLLIENPDKLNKSENEDNDETYKIIHDCDYDDIIIFAHGHLSRYQFFYLLKNNKKKYIPDDLWQFFNTKDKLAYFHVCYGSQILIENHTMAKQFLKWVSYSQDPQLIICDDKTIININKKLFTEIFSQIDNKNPHQYKETLRKIYKSLGSDLIEDFPGRTGIIQLIGHNFNCIEAH